jgi:hypothetical protein
MKFKLIIRNENDNIIQEKIYTSINQIAKDLDATYCSCQSNYLMNIGELEKMPKKRSQLIFNKKYTITNA